MNGLSKARRVKRKNDLKRKQEVGKQIVTVEKILSVKDTTVTAACREAGLAVDKYYRHKRDT
jgi:hypothetical protein